MTNTRFVELTRKIPYLALLDSRGQEQLFQSAVARSFSTNEVIFLEGEAAVGLWLIESGQVKIAKINPEGNEYILHLLNAGDSFNDIAVLENSTNPATATALSEAKCWVLPTEVIQEILETNPYSAKAAITMLTARVRMLVHQLENLALYSVTTRLARFLLHQAESPILEGAVTRQAVAAHLATTPETVSRALRSLEQAGAIQFSRHQIEIVRPDILRALAMIDPS